MKIRHEHSGYFGPAPLHCPCCGTKESQSGCVRGFTCQCDWKWCKKCFKCSKHCQCAQQPEQEPLDPEVAAIAKKYLEEMLSGTTCPVCHQPITEEKQMGLCVYGVPCGHRMYQGTAKRTIESPGEA